MSREDARKILGENATEEQISNLLANLHERDKANNQKIVDLETKLNNYSDYDSMKSKLDEIERASMTEQQLLEAQKKEIAENLKESRITKNKAKVMTILAGLEIDEDIIDSLVGEDENISVSRATKLKSKLTSLSEEVAKKTKEDLMTLDVKPTISNVSQNEKTMDLEKFMNLTAEEQEKFIAENPNSLENLR